VLRKRAKGISKPDFRSGQREVACNKPQRELQTLLQISLTGNIQRTTTSDISAEAVTSFSLLENCSSNQLPVENISYYSEEAMDLTPIFEKDPVLASAINSYSYNNAAEDQFDLRFPARLQTFSADLGR
jgi:hypothetical protein